MYRTVKMIHGSPTMFVLIPLLLYVTTTTLSLVVAEDETSLSHHSEIKEAQKIVGHFLHDEAGTRWLSELAKTNSAPLSTLDLMNAIRKITKKDSAVWKAAKVLVDALESGDSDVTRPDWSMGDNENWKDLIDNIEMEDDIICLYRKSTNETTKKAEDWKQFLATVTPGYTVHLAIDTGIKYIICLKKLEQPIVDEQPSSTVTTVNNETPTIIEETLAETHSQESMKNRENVKSFSSMGQENSRVITDLQSHRSDEECDDSNMDDNKRARPEDIEDYSDVDKKRIDDDYDSDTFENLRKSAKMRRGMTFEKTKVDEGSYKPIGRINSSPRKMADIPLTSREMIAPNKIDSPSTEISECNRPIVFIVPDGNVPPINQEAYSNSVPFQSSLDQIWPFKNSNSNHKILPTYKSLNIAGNLPHPMSQRNLGKWANGYKIQNNPIPSRYTHLSNDNPSRIRLNTNQIARKALDPKLYDEKFHESIYKLPRDYIDDQRHSTSNFVPLKFDKQSTPHARINLPLSNRGSSKHDQWRLKSGNFPHPIFRTVEKLKQAKNDYLLRLEEAKNTHRIGQLNKNPHNGESDRASIYRFQTELPKMTRQPIVKPLLMNQGVPMRFTPFSNSNINARESKLSKLPSATSDFQSPCVNFDRWFDIQQQMPISNSPISNSLAYYLENPLSLPRSNGPRNCPMTADRLFGNNGVTCPCERPIKLQIIVNGKVQEPLSFTVVTEADQKIEISRSFDRSMPYGSRALTDTGVSALNDIYDTEENIQSESNEGSTQRNADGMEESLINGTRFEHNDTEEEKLTIQKDTQTTSLGPNGEIIVDDRNIEERFLHDTTTESIVSLETNGTTTVTVNSTNIV